MASYSPHSSTVPGSIEDPIRGPGGMLDLPLGKMIIQIVVRLEDAPYTTVRLENTVQACLQRGVQSSVKTTDIKLNKVFRVFQPSLEEKLPGLGLDFCHGSFFYYRDNAKVLVKKQVDFQNAVQRLFNANKVPPMNNILVFNFIPETINEKRNRQARERARANIAEKARKERATSNPTSSRVHELPVRSISILMQVPENIQGLTEKKSSSSSLEKPDPPPRRPRRLSLLSSALQSIKSPPLGPGRTALRPPSRAFTLSGIFGKGTETDEEAEERYDSMVGIVSVEAFQRGGTDDYIPMPPKNGLEEGITSDEKSDDEDSEDEEAAINRAIDEPDDTAEDNAAKMLKSLLSLEELKQIRSTRRTVEGVEYEGYDQWAQCSLMFYIDGRRQGIADMVKIAGLKSPIYQYQALAVYWQMHTSRTVGGGFLADEMGLGKTLTFLAYIVVERQLSVLWSEVTKSRREDNGKHLQVNQHKSGDECPSPRKSGWIGCPCASSNPASKMAPKPGARLAIVPPGLVSSWRQDWKAHVDLSEATLNMRLLIAHQSTLIGAPEVTEDAYRAVNSRKLAASRKRDKDGYVYIKAKPDQEKFLVLSTQDSFPSWVRGHYEFKADKVREVGKDENGKTTKNVAMLSVIFGIAAADECHGDYQKNKGRSKILAGLPGRPYCWGISGSPFPQTPRGLEGVLWAIETHATKTHPYKRGTAWEEPGSKMARFSSNYLDYICTQFENYMKSSKSKHSIEALAAELKPFLTTFMIRRLADSTWFKHPLVQLKPHIHQDILIKHNNIFDSQISVFNVYAKQEMAKRLETLQYIWDHDRGSRNGRPRPEKITFNTQSRLLEKSRMMADFPFLAKMASAPLHLELSSQEVVPLRVHEKNKQINPYFRHLKVLVESSPKCLWLRQFIKWLVSEVDYEGRELKLVIVSKFNPVLFIIKMFIEKHFPDKVGRVGIIYPGQKPPERTNIHDAFTDKDDGNGQRTRKENYQFLLGPTSLIGQGLQLTRACHLVLFEPDSQHHLEKQAYARINRIGQKNPYSFSYRLVDGDHDAEFAILNRQISRQEFPGRFLPAEQAAMLGESMQVATHPPPSTRSESSSEEPPAGSDIGDPPPPTEWPFFPADPLTTIPRTEEELERFRAEEILQATEKAADKEREIAAKMRALAEADSSSDDDTRRATDSVLDWDDWHHRDRDGNRVFLDDNSQWVPALQHGAEEAEIVSPESGWTTPVPRQPPSTALPPPLRKSPTREARANRLRKFKNALPHFSGS
ncbi:hypothetical protein B7494_g362 [Chlorociboria aeruginascens]|nr:hypothetical protein B7494_g362 [Chlorociboria aeruginascens]